MADQTEEQCTMPWPLKRRQIAAPLPLSITVRRLLLLKCSNAEGQQQQETSSTDKPHTDSDLLIGVICVSVHSHYPELYLQDGGKDEWLVNQSRSDRTYYMLP